MMPHTTEVYGLTDEGYRLFPAMQAILDMLA